MPLIRLLTGAILLATAAGAQENDALIGPLIGQWNCSVLQTVKLQTGRIADKSVSPSVVEFRSDHTARIAGAGQNATWSGTSDKLVVQLDKQARLMGKLAGDFLTMLGDRFSNDRSTLTHSEWTCRKRPD